MVEEEMREKRKKGIKEIGKGWEKSERVTVTAGEKTGSYSRRK